MEASEREAARAAIQSWRPGAGLSTIERYGRFDILGRIGRGGMAEILLARERGSLGAVRHLVIKRIAPEVADNDEMLHMFLDEARLVMGLSHPNLCQIYDVGEQDGSWHIAMEWVNGATLHELIRRAQTAGGMDVEVMASIISQCAEALHHAHLARDSEGKLVHLVHRDVSPHNIMVAYDGRVKLLDFGIAKSAVSTHRTEAGIVKGKVCYLAPEQWQSAPVDARTDIFALGCCLFEAISGRVLYRRESQADVMRAVLVEPAPDLSDEVAGVPAALGEIARKALAIDPTERFQSALEMSDAIEHYLASTVGAVRPARIAAFVRGLFPAEVQLGPVLERAIRGALLDDTHARVGPSLPPLPMALQGLAAPRPISSPRSVSLPPPAGSFAHAFATPPSRPAAHSRLSEASLLTMDVQVDESAATGRHVSSLPPQLGTKALRASAAAPVPASRRVMVVFSVAIAALSVVLGVMLMRPSAGLKSEGSARVSRTALDQSPSLAASAALPIEAAASFVALPGAPEFVGSSEAAPTAEAPPDELTHDASEPAVSLERTKPRGRVNAKQGAQLSVNTRPWSKVYLGKRLLGTTPLAHVRVPAGPIALRLVDRDGKVHFRKVAKSKEPHRNAFYDFAANPK